MVALRATYCAIHRFGLLLLIVAGLLTPAWAQVPTTITSDGSLGTTVTQDGGVFEITDGTQQGRNLFHSFDRFDVGTGDIARFIGLTNIDNILSRVTGGQQSMIDGTLQSDIAGANLYLLNPSGVIFGPNARLEVQGSFHVSTADVLRLADGAAFSTQLSARSTLTVASPSAFGFLSDHPAGIEVQGSELALANRSLSIIGSDIKIEAAASISAPGGQVNLVSVASRGEVEFDLSGVHPEVEVESFDKLGEVEIANDSRIDVRGANGDGQIILRGGRLVIDNALVQGGTVEDIGGNWVGVDVEVSDEVVLTNRGVIGTRADEADRHAADIRISAGHLQMESSSLITSQTATQGNAGAIVVETEHLRLTGGAQIASSTFGPGEGGTVTVRATEVTLDGTTQDSPFGSGIFANAAGDTERAGDAGAIVVEAEHLRLTGGAQIISATFGPGKGGTVMVRTTEMTLEEASGIVASAEGDTERAGDAGAIVVEAEHLRLTGGAQIISATFGPGQGGTVTVRATEMALRGATPDNSFPSGISANAVGDTERAGGAGAVVIEAEHLRLTGGAQIASSTSGPGKGGTVMVRATEITLEGGAPDNSFPSGILADAAGDTERAGDAGAIVVEAEHLRLTGGAQIASSTFGSGEGGTVMVHATEITLQGVTPDSLFGSGIFASAQGDTERAGDAGAIVVEAEHLRLNDGAQITSSTFGSGEGGTVMVRATEMTLEVTAPDSPFPSGIFANAGPSERAGDAGAIVVEAGHFRLTGGAQIASSTLGPGEGGSVTIMATGTVTIVGSRSGIFTTTAVSGAGGNIVLQAQQVQLTEEAMISSASSGRGNAGNIRIAAQNIDLRDHSIVTTTADQGEASGGNILIGGTIAAHGNIIEGLNRLSLREGSRIIANTDAGDGANITIGAQHVVLDSGSEIAANTNTGVGGNVTIAGTVMADGQALSRAGTIVLLESDIRANAQGGQGGRIDIIAEVFLVDSVSELDASSQEGGIDGEVNVDSAVSNLSGLVTPLPLDFAAAAELLRSRCAERVRGIGIASFVQAGRDRIPPEPGDRLPSPLIFAHTPVRQSAWPTTQEHYGQSIPMSILAELNRDCVH